MRVVVKNKQQRYGTPNNSGQPNKVRLAAGGEKPGGADLFFVECDFCQFAVLLRLQQHPDIIHVFHVVRLVDAGVGVQQLQALLKVVGDVGAGGRLGVGFAGQQVFGLLNDE